MATPQYGAANSVLRTGEMPTVALLATVALVLQSSALMLGPLLVELGREFEISIAAAGQLATATFIAWAIVAPLSGPVSDSYGRRVVILTGMALITASLLGSAFAWNYGTLVALRVLTGVGGALIPSQILAVVADTIPLARHGRAVGLIIGGLTLSSVVGVSGVAILADAGGWRLPFVVLGSAFGVLGLICWRWFPKSGTLSRPPFAFFSRFKQIGSNRTFLYGILANACQQMVFFTVFSYLAAYLTDSYDTGTGGTALPLAVVGMGAVIGSLTGGVVATRPNGLSLAAICFLGAGLLFVPLFAADISLWVTVALAFGTVNLLSIGLPVLATLVMTLAGESRATAIGIFATSNQIGGVGGAAAGGLMLALGGFPMLGVFGLAAGTLAAGLIRTKVQSSRELAALAA